MGSRGRGNVRVYIDGDSSGLGRATKQAETHLGKFGNRVSSLGSKMTSAGSTLTKGVTLPVLGIGAVAGKVAIDFDKSMRNVNSIAQLPEKQFHKLEHSVLNLAGPTAQAPKTLADGLYDLVSSGHSAKESLGILDKSAKAATAGLTTTEVASAAVSAALNSYHLPAKKAGQVSDQLFETVNRGVITFEDLATNIGDVMQPASALGIGLGEVGASISTMTKEGIPTAETMTRIKNVMLTLVKPGKDLSKAIQETGFSSGEALVHQKGFEGGLKSLIGTTDGTQESVAKLFPNIRALTGALALTGKNTRSAQKDLKAFADTSGATDKALGEQKKSLAFKWQKFNAELQETAIKVAPPFLRAGKEILGEVGDMVKSFDELSPSTKNLIIKIGLLGAALGPVLTIGGNLLKVFGGTIRLADKTGMAFRKIGTAAQTVASGSATTGASAATIAPGRMAGVRASFGTYDLARSFGRGRAASALAQAGATTSAGLTAAKGFAGSFAKGLAPAIATVGLGKIIYSASSGDMKKAGFEAGGALVGGIAGAMTPLGPEGAMLGAGIGTFVGGALSGLFDTEKKLTPLQARMRAESEHVARALTAQGQAAHGLVAAETKLTQSNQRHRVSTQALKTAHQQLNAAVRKFGPDSLQAHQAEMRLSQAQHRDAVTANEAKQAHKLAGNELRLYQHRTVEAVASEKQRIPGLQRMVQHLRKQYSQEEGNYRLLGRLVGKEKDLSGARRHINDLIEQAASKSGPKFARSLERMTAAQAQFGTHFHTLVKQLPEFGRESQHVAQVGGGAWVDYRGTVHTQTMRAAGDVKSFATGTKVGFKEIEVALGQALTSLGVKSVNFTTGGGSSAPGKAQGGMVTVPGQGLHDTVPLAVNGALSAVVAPGEKLIASNRHQTPELDYAVWNTFGDAGLEGFFRRSKRPHYLAKGGLVHPRLSGPDPMQNMGQHSIDRVYKAARKYLSKIGGDKSVRALVKEGNRMDALRRPYLWGGGHGAMPSKNGPWDCSGGISELFYGAGWKALRPMVSSGFEGFGSPGKGRASILANAEHVYAIIDGKAIGTSAGNPGGGFGWISGYTYRPGFTVRHVDLAGEGLPKSRRTGRGQAQKKGFAGGGVITGKVSYFGGGATAGGSDTSKPGIALNLNPGTESGWNNAKTQGWRDDSLAGHPDYARVTIEGKSANLPITDMGPAASTGRAIDVTEGGVRKLGFTTSNFPTDAVGTAEILGGGSGSKESAAERKEKTPVHGRTKLSFEEKVSRLDTRIAKAETTAGLKDDRRAAMAKLDLLRGRKRYLEKKVRGINKKLKGKLKPPVREKLLQQRESYLGELSSLPGEASGLIENLREAGEGPKALKKAARGFGIGTRDPNAEKVTARDRADLQLARAEMTPGKEDDLAALQRLVDVSKQELKVAKKSGDPRKIAEATRNLKDAADALREATPTAQDYANRDLALAELTETLSDDQAALEAMIALDEQQLAAALQTPDPRDDIEAAQNLRAHRDALKSLKDSIDQQSEILQQREEFEKERLDLDKRLANLAETQGPAVLAALASWVDGAIGGPAARRMGLPATPGVAAGYR